MSREYVSFFLKFTHLQGQNAVEADYLCRRQTLRADDSEKEDSEISAKFLGFTPGGAPIMKFADEPGGIEPGHGVVVGRGDGHVIIAFRKTMAVVNGDSSDSDGAPGPSAGATGAAEPPRDLAPGGSSTRTPTSRPKLPPVVRIAPLPGTSNDSPV